MFDGYFDIFLNENRNYFTTNMIKHVKTYLNMF